MKNLIIKSINILLIAGGLLIYQDKAINRNDEKIAFENESKKIEQKKMEIEMANKDEASLIYKDGTYKGSGEGFGGEIIVEVTLEKDYIKEAKIISKKNETPEYISQAEKILDEVVSKQTIKVDAVSGATLSSNGILAALDDAMNKAKK
ncbi:FMN-binding protein [Eubacterium sp.]|uniref:FMN-binding protein n=1 Tax=Eubacterium sp. TaxID=142586 RepID=UPI0025EA6134|nr:FMN-binding protein [Eubacterium sp.]MCR5629206.1 FMN-binding protein [Eubacterium sp.]